MKRFCIVVIFLTLLFLQQTVFLLQAADDPTAVAAGPHMLQLRGVLIRSHVGDKLEQGLWMTEPVNDKLAQQILQLQNPVRNANAYRMLALDAKKRVLNEVSFTTSRSDEVNLELDLLLPAGTNSVELRTPDGSLVQNGIQFWPEPDQAPRLSELRTRSLEYGGRKLQVSWACYGASDGYALWYTPDGMDWHFLAATAATNTVIDLGNLPGGQLEENRFGEMRLVACNGLATGKLGLRIEVDWLAPYVWLPQVEPDTTLTFNRTETIDLQARAWDEQERWLIYDRVLWIDDRGGVIGSESNLLLSAERYPVGRYTIQAMTMNARQQSAGQWVDLVVQAQLTLEGDHAPYFDRDGGLWVPLREVMYASGWWVGFDDLRREVQLNGFETSFSVSPNGDLWLDGIWTGQITLWNRNGSNWISARDLMRLGFAYLTWDAVEGTLVIAPQ